MSGKVASQPAARTTPARKPPAAKEATTTFTRPSVKTTFTPARVQTTFTPSRLRTTFAPAGVSTTFTPDASRNARYTTEDAFLADPVRMSGSKVVVLKRLMRGDVDAQRVALKHLAKPAWIHYLKTHDNKLVRLIEKVASAKQSLEQGRHVKPRERMQLISNHKRARIIWKMVGENVRLLRMKRFVGDRCDFSSRALNKLNKKGLERLFKSVTSFRPPRECRL